MCLGLLAWFTLHASLGPSNCKSSSQSSRPDGLQRQNMLQKHGSDRYGHIHVVIPAERVAQGCDSSVCKMCGSHMVLKLIQYPDLTKVTGNVQPDAVREHNWCAIRASAVMITEATAENFWCISSRGQQLFIEGKVSTSRSGLMSVQHTLRSSCRTSCKSMYAMAPTPDPPAAEAQSAPHALLPDTERLRYTAKPCCSLLRHINLALIKLHTAQVGMRADLTLTQCRGRCKTLVASKCKDSLLPAYYTLSQDCRR